jgi:hypothetical protein
MRNKKIFRKEFTVTQLAQGKDPSIAHLEKVLYTARAHTTGAETAAVPAENAIRRECL